MPLALGKRYQKLLHFDAKYESLSLYPSFMLRLSRLEDEI
jgi:hypothetical protein